MLKSCIYYLGIVCEFREFTILYFLLYFHISDFPFLGNNEKCECNEQGVLKLTFNNSNGKRAQIRLYLLDPQGWTFNAGDSETNNGYGECTANKFATFTFENCYLDLVIL